MVNATVLIVDDEAPFVETLAKRLIILREFKVFSAHSGPEALDVLENEKNIDVVILDLKMPGMDGIDVLLSIKAERPEIEVMLLTAYAGLDIALKAMKSGAFDCLTKPCGVEAVCARVVEAREKKWKREEISMGGL